MTVLNVRDANTGDFVPVDLSNPSGTIYVNDGNTGEIIPVTLSSGAKGLTDYQNVVVVDPAGNGDYATLAAAMAAIADAATGKRYAVYCFGLLTLAENTTIKAYCDLFGPGTIDPTASYTLTLAGNNNVRDLVLKNAQQLRSSTTTPTWFYDCEINIAVDGSWTNCYFALQGCRLDGISRTLTIDGASQIRLYHVTNRNNSGTRMTVSLAGTCQFEMHNSYIEGTLNIAAATIVALRLSNSTFRQTSDPALYITSASAPSTVTALNCVFQGTGGAAVQCDSFTWSAAPFYNCVFNGTMTQFAPDASSVNF